MLRQYLALDYSCLNFIENVLEDFFQKVVPIFFVTSDVGPIEKQSNKNWNALIDLGNTGPSINVSLIGSICNQSFG